MAIITETHETVAGTIIQVLSLPANTVNAISDINIVNASAAGDDAVVSVYIANVDSPVLKHKIEHQVPLRPGEPLTRNCGPIAPGERIFVECNIGDVAIRATAIIETA
jgi:hypothetical protein